MKTLNDFKADPENPRQITENGEHQLKESIDRFGNIAGIVWNKRTEELVTGHQRMSQLREKYPNAKCIPVENESGSLTHYNIENNGYLTGFSIRVVDWSIEEQKA
ncbi:MAG: hypothetical protein OXF77_03075, partial [Thaumarchaeota archaeon]|nr:hypothetical protein [Nitrososphaerota archaeon]